MGLKITIIPYIGFLEASLTVIGKLLYEFIMKPGIFTPGRVFFVRGIGVIIGLVFVHSFLSFCLFIGLAFQAGP